MLRQRVDRGRDPVTTLVEIDLAQVSCSAQAWTTAAAASSLLIRGGPGIGVPSTGVTWLPGMPVRCHSPPTRLRIRSESNASGAAVTQRAYVSHHEVPGLSCNGMCVFHSLGILSM